jgi:hypothetical protein
MGLVLLATACSVSRKDQLRLDALAQQQAVIEEAKRTVKSLLAPQVTKQLGLEKVRIFGPNDPEVEDVPSPTETYRSVQQFWCDGLRPDGTVARLRCRAEMQFKVTGEKTACLISPPVLRADGPLSFGRQFSTWVGVTLGCLVLVLLYTVWLMGWKGASVLAWIVLLPASGYAAFVCFGSAMAVVVCLVSLTPLYVWATAAGLGAEWAREAPGVAGIAIVWVLALGVAGLLLWKAVPYVVRGTAGWFGWLFGHF